VLVLVLVLIRADSGGDCCYRLCIGCAPAMGRDFSFEFLCLAHRGART
jgi:hypothetical protein